MLETLEQQKENYFCLFVNAIEEVDRQHWLEMLNEVLSEMIELKYCT